MTISLIAAVSRNGIIGNDGGLPWHLPEDLRRFRKLTTGKPVLMGRKTYQSIGRPLPARKNIVISRDPHFSAPGCVVVSCPAAALDAVNGADEVMVIGGGQIYQAFMRLANRVYLTRVDVDTAGDTRFPRLEDDAWQLTSSEPHGADEDHAHEFSFEIFDRLPPDSQP